MDGGSFMEKARLCLQPVYVDQFQCDGSQCSSKCCKKWIIEVDGNTYQRYCGIKSKEERKRITSQIKWEKGRNGKNFFVKLRKDGSCPFLREDGFCDIQKKYGEHYLSKVCATYPRTIHHLDDITERSLTLSCPVAAKLILLRKDPIEFEQLEMTEHRPVQSALWDMKAFPLGEYLIDLQYSCISLLQNRKLTLDQRLILMGFFLEQVEDLAAGGREKEIRALAQGYVSDQVAESAKDLVKEISRHTRDYLKCMFGMVEVLYGKGTHMIDRGDQEYLDALKSLYGFSEDMEAVPMSKLMEVYNGYHEHAQEIVGQYSYVFENCMVNEFFIDLYPMSIKGSLTENYLFFLMRCKLMEFLTVALAVVHKEEPEEKVLVEGLSFFAGRMRHSVDYRKHILDEIRRYHKDVGFFMRTLLEGYS